MVDRCPWDSVMSLEKLTSCWSRDSIKIQWGDMITSEESLSYATVFVSRKNICPGRFADERDFAGSNRDEPEWNDRICRSHY